MDNILNIRSYSWYQNGLSWAYVCERLINAFDELGHNTYVVSTNGLNESSFNEENKMLKSVLELQKFGPGKKKAIDLDWCYTVPPNFPKRFLSNSKHKCAIYNFETTYWPKEWKKFYHLVDFYFPSSNFSAEIFHINGIPKEKIFVIPHGVDTNVFNPSISPIKLKTNKKFKFVSIVAPHYRKNIDLLLESYCEAFTAKDDVCLVLKTKVFKYSDGIYDAQKNPNGRKAFEIVIGDIFKKLYKKYGRNIPEIELLNGHVANIASVYNSCDIHISTTGSEGYGMIFTESMASGLINIAPRYSGQLDFLNDNNSLLIDTKLRRAKRTEQYWGYDKRSVIGQASKQHTIELMRKAVAEKDQLLEKFKPHMDKMVASLTWKNAAQMMINATEGGMNYYKPGTYNTWPK